MVSTGSFAVWGAGGCGRGIMPLARAQETGSSALVFIDDGKEGSAAINGHEVLSSTQFAQRDGDRYVALAVASAVIRRKMAQRAVELNLLPWTICAADHVRFDDVDVGPGALISPYSVFTSNIRIGSYFHCNLYSYVEHDCVIGDFVTFAPGVRCNGNVTIGNGAYIGSGAIIRQGLTIGAGATIGMGAVVTKNVPAGETWVGNPARPLDRKG